MIDIENKQNHIETDPRAEQILRLRADFVDFKRRMKEQREVQIKLASEGLIRRLLPVLDDLDRAINNIPEGIANEDWCKGVALVERNLRLVLEREGVSRIDTCGCDFDPNEHEAVFIQEGKAEEQGKIRETIRNGYKMHDKVIRPAQVSVIQGIKREPAGPNTVKIPERRGGDTRWMASRSVQNARAMYS